MNEEIYCVLCEAEDREVLAFHTAKFDEDDIPVCKKHKAIVEETHIEDILNEQN
jgi:hypothetical protein